MNVRDVLNKIKWKRGYIFDEVEVWYIDRGAPGDRSVVTGREISRIGRSFLYTDKKSIPFHRVIKIVYRGEVMFDRFKLRD